MERIFHIDTECYVVYLGQKEQEERPFLRLGFSRRLPEKIHQFISTVVISDVFTGDIFGEKSLFIKEASGLHRPAYVGSPETLKRLKNFFGCSVLPTSKFVQGKPEDHNHSYVLFYEDANLAIMRDNATLLNLRNRQSSDGHYIQRCRKIKDIFSRNSSRRFVTDASLTGFTVVNNTLYILKGGKFRAFGLEADYYARLTAAGYNPDAISMASGDPRALFRLLSHAKENNSSLTILDDDIDMAEKIASLFFGEEFSRAGIAIEKYDRNIDRSFGLVEAQETLYRVAFDRMPPFAIDLADRRIIPDASAAQGAIPIVDGVFYQVGDRSYIGGVSSVDRYIEQFGKSFRTMLSGSEARYLELLIKGVSSLAYNRLAQSAQTLLLKEGAVIASTGSQYMRLMFHNLRGVLSVLTQWEGLTPKSKKTADEWAAKLARIKHGPLVALPGLVVDFHTSDSGYISLYRFSGEISNDAIAVFQDSSNRILETEHPDRNSWFESEREKLYGLMELLGLVKHRDSIRAARQAKADKSSINDSPDGRSNNTTSRPANKKRIGSRKRREGRVAAIVAIVAAAAVLAGLAIVILPRIFGGSSAPSQNEDVAQRLPGAAEFMRNETTSSDSPVAQPALLPEAAPLITENSNTNEQSNAIDGAQTDSGSPGESFAEQSSDQGDLSENMPNVDSVSDNQIAAAAARPEISGERQNAAGGQQDSNALNNQDGPIATDELLSAVSQAASSQADTRVEPRDTDIGITVTVRDIVFMANTIALDNGYQRIGISSNRIGENPDWIFPGNDLELPSRDVYEVLIGDTIWDIATNYIEEILSQHYRQYQYILGQHNAGEISDREYARQLSNLADESVSEQFSAIVLGIFADIEN